MNKTPDYWLNRYSIDDAFQIAMGLPPKKHKRVEPQTIDYTGLIVGEKFPADRPKNDRAIMEIENASQ